jgi:hypothetical protein
LLNPETDFVAEAWVMAMLPSEKLQIATEASRAGLIFS